MSLVATLTESKRMPVLVDAHICSGRTYIITGGNTGLGLEAARHLVHAHAARVIISSRSIAAGEKARADIERSTGREGVVQVWQLDLSSFASVKAFSRRALEELDRIDALVENAGVFLNKFTLSEGNETSMTVNVISAVLLAAMLMPKMMESAERFKITPRLVLVGSALAFHVKGEMAKSSGESNIFKGFNDPKRTNMNERYSLTKLVQLYAVREFAAQFPPERTGVIINTTAPGLCSTDLGRDTGMLYKVTLGVLRAMFARTAEEGSRTTLHGIVADEESHGKFLSGCEIKDYWIPDWVTDEKGQRIQKKIWKEIVDIVEATEPGCISRIN